MVSLSYTESWSYVSPCLPGRAPEPARPSSHWVPGLVFQVTMPGEPVDVACGVDHMVTLAKSFI